MKGGDILGNPLTCEKCRSLINLVKARRRYTKKYGLEPTGISLGMCACGKTVYDKNYYGKECIMP